MNVFSNSIFQRQNLFLTKDRKYVNVENIQLTAKARDFLNV